MIININKANQIVLTKLKKLCKLQLGKDLFNFEGYVKIQQESILGYLLYTMDNDTVKIHWIYAKPGHGSELLTKVEGQLRKYYKRVILNLSIDQQELKSHVMRRINFYIKNNYRVYNIIYRKQFGVELQMEKNI